MARRLGFAKKKFSGWLLSSFKLYGVCVCVLQVNVECLPCLFSMVFIYCLVVCAYVCECTFACVWENGSEGVDAIVCVKA